MDSPVAIKDPNFGKPNYTRPLPSSNDAGKIPPRQEIKEGGKDTPHSDMPKTMNWVSTK